MVAPHIHPRSNEYLLNFERPPLLATLSPEYGAHPVSVELGAGNVTIRPMDSVSLGKVSAACRSRCDCGDENSTGFQRDPQASRPDLSLRAQVVGLAGFNLTPQPNHIRSVVRCHLL